jgi:hypothetical protein
MHLERDGLIDRCSEDGLGAFYRRGQIHVNRGVASVSNTKFKADCFPLAHPLPVSASDEYDLYGVILGCADASPLQYRKCFNQ